MSRPLSNYLKTFRKRACLTQREVALLIGVASRTQVSRHESGDLPPSHEATLAYLLLYRAAVEKLFRGEVQQVDAVIRLRAVRLLEKLTEAPLSAVTAEKRAFLEALRDAPRTY